MIYIQSIESVEVERFDEVWAIVRKLGENPKQLKQVQESLRKC